MMEDKTSPTGSMKQSLSASIDLARASIDSNTKGCALVPPVGEQPSQLQNASSHLQHPRPSTNGTKNSKSSDSGEVTTTGNGSDGAGPS